MGVPAAPIDHLTHALVRRKQWDLSLPGYTSTNSKAVFVLRVSSRLAPSQREYAKSNHEVGAGSAGEITKNKNGPSIGPSNLSGVAGFV